MFRRSRGRFRFRARRRRSFRGFKRTTKTWHYGNLTTATAIATGATATIPLISAADSPGTTTVADLLTAGTPCQTDNGSRVRGFVKFAISHGQGVQVIVSVLLWKDVGYGGVTDPTTGDAILTPGNTSNLRVQKQGAMVFRRLVFNSQKDIQTITLPIKGRNATLREGETIRVLITNHSPGSISYSGYMRLVSYG